MIVPPSAPFMPKKTERETVPVIEATARVRVNSFGEAVWRFFCSVKLAMSLIALIAFATLLGTVIIQMPPELLGDSASRKMWTTGMQPRFGDLTGIMFDLGLFNLFSTLWFKGLLAVLTLNIVVCTLNRLPATWKQATATRMKVGPRFYAHGEYAASYAFAATTNEVAGKLPAALAGGLRVRYQESQADEDGSRSFYADRFHLLPLGTYLNHIGIVLIFIGAIWGTLMGDSFKLVDFAVPQGGSREVGQGTGLVVYNNGFFSENYPDGRPADYRSDLTVTRNGQEIARKTIRVNDPLDIDGVKFHQAFFGNAADIEVKDATGTTVYKGSVPLAYRSKMYGPTRPMGSFSLGNGEVQVDVVSSAGQGDEQVKPGQMYLRAYAIRSDQPLWEATLGQRQSSSQQGLTVTFQRERLFSGLQVGRDPGMNLVVVASSLMIFGIMLVFYFPVRRLWVRVEPREGGSVVLLKGQASRRAGLAGKMLRVGEDLQAAGGTMLHRSAALDEEYDLRHERELATA